MKFEEMGLTECVLRGLTAQGICESTEIQERTLPLIKMGVDVLGLSQTGSGKTYAFGIPAIEFVDQSLPATQVLIICPTRELVRQVVEDLKKLIDENTRIRVTPIYGGANMDRQVEQLKRGAKIVVGTPGRLMDHLRRKTLRLDYLKMVVLDEADEMLQMGFKQDIETILKSTKAEQRQTVMFSATMPSDIQKLITQFMREPQIIKSQNHECSHALIRQFFINCKRTEKTEMMEKIYNELHPYISIVFCNTKKMTEDLSYALRKKGLPAVCLHGDMRQRERTRTLENFKRDGGILVATDVAARGIDIKNVDIVVNFDFPNNDEYYTHRIGRTGRAGKPGTAITLINTIQQAKALQDITLKLGGKVEEFKKLSIAQSLADEPTTTKKKPRLQQRPSQRQKPRPEGQRPGGFKKKFGSKVRK
ncbi:MAG: DEAD/DEAH box helicase [Firmicutes bacterium]|nr:DEAD/DEAH box helicase [Bacillota bacterium]